MWKEAGGKLNNVICAEDAATVTGASRALRGDCPYSTMLCMHLRMCTHLRTSIDLARSTLSSLPFFSKKTIDKVTIIDQES